MCFNSMIEIFKEDMTYDEYLYRYGFLDTLITLNEQPSIDWFKRRQNTEGSKWWTIK